MDYQELLGIIKNPEEEVCELKSSFSEWEDIAKTIAAFSTKRGGKIFVGVDKRGMPCGTFCNNEIKGRLQTLANNEIKPPAQISTELINHDSVRELVVAVIHVKKGFGAYSYRGVHYERRGPTNHPLSGDEIFEIHKNVQKLYFDEMPSFSEERPALVSDIDSRKVTDYLIQTKKYKESLDLKRFLANNSYLVNGSQQVKNAAIMIFGVEPQKFIPQLKLSIAIFTGKEVTDQFVKKEFTGAVQEIYQHALVELQRNISVYSFVEGSQRFDIPEYPLEVIRECLINSLVHRDYFVRNTETFVKMFTDRIEFANPASFPFENFTFDEIKKTKISKRRNPMIAENFESLSLMEKVGRGLSKIENGMKAHGLPAPIFDVGSTTFMVTLKNSEKKNVLKGSPYKKIINFEFLNERQRALVQAMSKLDRGATVSRSDYIKILLTSKGLQIAELTASRDLSELVGRNILTKTGDRRGAKYYLT